ncbi:hypothetical protein BY996DRAFT_6408295 [Phakopsora pachyrhizi]|nr:hypothetical protein BY996DRAFT_6408295 [Phakopsora pachyrhizi]
MLKTTKVFFQVAIFTSLFNLLYCALLSSSLSGTEKIKRFPRTPYNIKRSLIKKPANLLIKRGIPEGIKNLEVVVAKDWTPLDDAEILGAEMIKHPEHIAGQDTSLNAENFKRLSDKDLSRTRLDLSHGGSESQQKHAGKDLVNSEAENPNLQPISESQSTINHSHGALPGSEKSPSEHGDYQNKDSHEPQIYSGHENPEEKKSENIPIDAIKEKNDDKPTSEKQSSSHEPQIHEPEKEKLPDEHGHSPAISNQAEANSRSQSHTDKEPLAPGNSGFQTQNNAEANLDGHSTKDQPHVAPPAEEPLVPVNEFSSAKNDAHGVPDRKSSSEGSDDEFRGEKDFSSKHSDIMEDNENNSEIDPNELRLEDAHKQNVESFKNRESKRSQKFKSILKRLMYRLKILWNKFIYTITATDPKTESGILKENILFKGVPGKPGERKDQIIAVNLENGFLPPVKKPKHEVNPIQIEANN